VDVKAEAERVCSSSSPTVGDDDADEAQEEEEAYVPQEAAMPAIPSSTTAKNTSST
jgi:hypothetical protein